MTDLIFRGSAEPRGLVFRWDRHGTPPPAAGVVEAALKELPATLCPVDINLSALNAIPGLPGQLDALAQFVIAQCQQPPEDEVQKEFAVRIAALAASILETPSGKAVFNDALDTIRREFKNIHYTSATAASGDPLLPLISTMIWNRMFDDRWQFLYFIPARFIGATAVSGLICAFEYLAVHPHYTVLATVVNRIFSLFPFCLILHQKNFFAHRSAVESIMARNMSHNIGSHVIPRGRVEVVRRRLNDLGMWPADPNDGLGLITYMKGRLDEYVQKKADFLAEITTEPLMSTRPAFFYREVILPLVENPLFMDNIAANEGVRYTRAAGEDDARYNRLQLHVSINGKAQGATYTCKPRNGDCQNVYRYPQGIPYSLH